jgi:hypothetical protein
LIAGSVNGTDLAVNSVNGAKVLNDSLTGLDINESTLAGGQIPGVGGGSGLSGYGPYSCGATGHTQVYCASTAVALPRQGRILVTAMGYIPPGNDVVCQIFSGASFSFIATTRGGNPYGFDSFGMSLVTDVLPAGRYVMALACNQFAGSSNVSWSVQETVISAVALGDA